MLNCDSSGRGAMRNNILCSFKAVDLIVNHKLLLGEPVLHFQQGFSTQPFAWSRMPQARLL